MTMRKALEVIAALADRGVIKHYAVTGAVAALVYIEPTLTQDLDVLISVGDLEQRASGLALLSPVEAALAEMGYTDRSDVGVLIEGWPVQFIPVSSDLDLESIEQHTEIYFDGDSALRIKVLMA